MPADQLKSLIGPMLTEFRNGIFADLRKAGALGGKAPKGDATETATPTTPATPAATDVQSIIARERAFTRAISGVKLSDAQYSRMERAFQLEKPDDPGEWVKGYVADLGVGTPPEGSVQQPTNPAPVRSAHPVSDLGGPAPVTTPSDQLEPWRLSKDDVAANVRRKGMAAAGAEYKQQLARALTGRSLRLK